MQPEELVFGTLPNPAPYWPGGHFCARETGEIVATLFWDGEDHEGYVVDTDGVVDDNPTALEDEFVGWWCLHILQEDRPCPTGRQSR